MLTHENKSPRTVSTDQSETAQEHEKDGRSRRGNSNIPIRADTAAWWVERIKKQYPRDYEAIANKAISLSRAGVRLSITSLFEWARLELFAGQKGKGVLKLNNSLRPAFARALMRDYPELQGKFETRKSVSDEVGIRVTPD